MYRDDKLRLRKNASRYGLSVSYELVCRLGVIALFLVGLIFAVRKQEAVRIFAEGVGYGSPIILAALTHMVQAYLLLGVPALVVGLLYPYGKQMARDQLESIGMVNRTGLAPELIRRRRDKENPRVTIWTFRNQSIPLITWENCQAELEAALDITIVKMKYGKGKRQVLLYAVPALTDLPKRIVWQDRYLFPDSSVLVLGESMMGPVRVDLSKTPHILLGGSTGSGKSVLLKLLLMQAIKKGVMVCVADFKGGVDFPASWRERCTLCYEWDALLSLLAQLTDILEERKGILREAGCPNIDVYNRTADSPLPRYIFACDEVAEILDKTGLTKEEKEQVDQVISRLSTIARQGRAFGIHLILATQRPDATVIPGQIRNNLDCRICGRADSVLSQIILDSTAAAEQIPKDVSGRFLLHDGTVFQAYWLDEDNL